VDNPDYKTDKYYVFRIAKEMKKEYDNIVSQGHILQIDAPDLAMDGAGDDTLGRAAQVHPRESATRPHAED